MNKPWPTSMDEGLRRILIEKMGFNQMALVQSVSLPIMMDNKSDVCVEACTGSGKSLAFILPMLEMLLKKRRTDKTYAKHFTAGLILTPTRELTRQIGSVIDQFLSNEPYGKFIQSWMLVGGRNAAYDVHWYEENGANLIVSTPGRLSEVLDRSSLLANQLKHNLELLVMDEADLLLQMGFESTLSKIFAYLPKQRRTCLFSATLTKRIDKLIRLGMRNPVRIEIKNKALTSSDSKGVPKKANPSRSTMDDEQLRQEMSLDQMATESLMSTGLHISPYLTNYQVTLPDSLYKLPFLIHFLNERSTQKVIVFFATCAQVNFFSQCIRPHLTATIPLLTLHRKVKQKRSKIFADFQQNQTGSVLFCTDVMSRGIDIPQIDWVINFDLPNDLQTFIHRSGRSGHKVGVQGNSLTICLPHECKYVDLCKQKSMQFRSFKFKYQQLDELRHTLTREMKQRTRDDVQFFKSGVKAFVSFIRTYSTKNILSLQLFKELDVVDKANAYALIKMPHMPEMAGRLKGAMTKLEVNENDAQIAKDHKKVLDLIKPSAKSIEQLEREEKRKKLGQKIKKMKGQKRRDYVNQLEMDELAADVRMLKKAKKHKVSEMDLDKHLGIK